MSEQFPGVDPVANTMESAFYHTKKNTDLYIEHSYHTQTRLVEGTYHHSITGYLQLTNKGETTLENIKVYVDPDDTGDFYDAYMCDSDGRPVQPQPGNHGFWALYFENLQKGEQSVRKSYHWSLRGPGGDTENFTVTPKIMPCYSVSYLGRCAFTDDVTLVEIT